MSIAEAVKDELATQEAAGTFGGLSWTPRRSYGDFDMVLADEDGEIRVDVVLVGSGIAKERRTQYGIAYSVPVDIGVRKKLLAEDEVAELGPSIYATANIDALTDLVESVSEYFDEPDRRLATYLDAVLDSAEIVSIGNTVDLKKHGQFTGIVRTVWDVFKELGA